MMSVLPFRSCRRPKIHLDLDVIKTNIYEIVLTGLDTELILIFCLLFYVFFFIYFSLVCFHGDGRKLFNTVTVAKGGI